MKKIILFISPIILLFSIYFISQNYFDQQDPSVNLSEQEDQNQKTEEDPPTDKDIITDEELNKGTSDMDDKIEDQQEEQEKPTEKEIVATKYYVTDKYFIKPVNPEDNSKVVLLTFDDAPAGKVTIDLLDTLDNHHAKAIFFVNGHYAVKHKDLLKEIFERGHIIGNHTWWHEDLRDLDMEKTKEEILKVNDLVEEVIGQRPVYFRPPFGAMSDNGRKVIKEEKMQSFNWSLGSLDWEYTKPEQKEKVVQQVMNTLNNGSIILMHDKEVTSLALDDILTELEEQGYSFVLPTEVEIN